MGTLAMPSRAPRLNLVAAPPGAQDSRVEAIDKGRFRR
jgi:hypothetical protein